MGLLDGLRANPDNDPEKKKELDNAVRRSGGRDPERIKSRGLPNRGDDRRQAGRTTRAPKEGGERS
ncbi:MAG: hypothetical protein GEV07_29695 [Streptosporangiales bacterium]|nr:hypothetical protein [Streptosporangiales bacterium]